MSITVRSDTQMIHTDRADALSDQPPGLTVPGKRILMNNREIDCI